MAIALVQSSSTLRTGGGGSAGAVTFSTPLTAGNFVVLVCSNYAGGYSTATGARIGALTVAAQEVRGTNNYLQILYKENVSAGTETIALSSASYLVARAYEFSGVATTAPKDASGMTTSGGTVTATTANTTAESLVIVGYTSNQDAVDNGYVAPTTGYTILDTTPDSSNDSAYLAAYKIVTALETSTATETPTITPATALDAVLATFKVAAAAGVTGTAVWTEDNDANAATGTVRVSGTAVWTEANDGNSATGNVRVSGTATWTEANDTNSASGIVGDMVAGPVAWTEDDDAASLAGGVFTPATGTIGWTEDSDGWSLSGLAGAAQAGGRATEFVIQTVRHEPLLKRIMDKRRAAMVKPVKKKAIVRAKAIEVAAAKAVIEGADEKEFRELQEKWLAERPALPSFETPSEAFMAQVAYRLEQMNAAEKIAEAIFRARRQEDDAILALLLA